MNIDKNQINFIFSNKLSAVKFFVLFGLFFLFLPIFSVQALSSGGVGGYPANPDPNVARSESWFVYNLDLGESKEDALLVFNTSDDTRTVKLYAVDSVPSNQGNFALAPEEITPTDLGAWIELSETFITLEPGESREVPFTVTIPDNADVGEHSAGIIIQKSSQAEALGQTGASIVTRVGIRVYETVPGEVVKNIELDDFKVELITPEDESKESYYNIFLAVVNKSTVSLNPEVDLEIGGFGKLEYFSRSNFNFKEGIVVDFKDLTDFFSGETLEKDWQLLREQKVSTRWEWPIPEFGRFTFQVKLTYPSNDGESQVLETPVIVIWIIPWVELIVVGSIILLIIIVLITRRLLYSGRKWVSYTVQRNDRLITIAKKSNVGWKKLAKVNKLRKPYSVEPGQKILIPSVIPISQKNKPTGVVSNKTKPANQFKTQPNKKIKNNK